MRQQKDDITALFETLNGIQKKLEKNSSMMLTLKRLCVAVKFKIRLFLRLGLRARSLASLSHMC
jgi:hypothetical protein